MVRDKYVDNAVGYIRVSTDLQASDPKSLEVQAQKIRKACLSNDFFLGCIHEDVGSAASSSNLLDRPGLEDARAHAVAHNHVLVVTEPTRLFRNVAVAREFLAKLDLKVFSVRGNRFLGRRALLDAIRRGETAAQEIRKGRSTI